MTTSKIKYSTFVISLTVILLGVMIIACVLTVNEPPGFFPLLSIFLILVIAALFWGAWSIKADSEYVIMKSPLRSKKILMRDIESVQLFQPTMGAIRICASGGFMGYWGIFKEGDIGRYYAFYGKSSDCFLIRTKNGDKYVLGCVNPEKMVNYIKEKSAVAS